MNFYKIYNNTKFVQIELFNIHYFVLVLHITHDDASNGF